MLNFTPPNFQVLVGNLDVTTAVISVSIKRNQWSISPEWACPNMLIFVKDGMIIGNQQNPENKLTQWWAEDHEIVPFNKSDYKSVKLID